MTKRNFVFTNELRETRQHIQVTQPRPVFDLHNLLRHPKPQSNDTNIENRPYRHLWAPDLLGVMADEPGAAFGVIVTRPTRQPGRATVGYYIGTEYWGQGVMNSVLSAFIRFGFETLDFYKIEATVFHTNQRAIRLAESVGMRREGTIRHAFFKRETWIDYELFAIFRDEPSILTRT
jgi:RimJ/RimL family protein N-acetyltransferase